MPNYLLRFLPSQRQVLEKLIIDFRLSFSNKNKLLIYIFEILKINETLSFVDLLAQLKITEILNDELIQGKHRGELLLARLFAIRFPETDRLIKEGKIKL